MFLSYIALLLVSAFMVECQRPSFAGNRPIGYPELYDRTTTPVNELGNRFGEGTTQRLPLEAKGDKDLVDRLSKLPIDQQPFWLINWQALEEQRKNPQTYPLRPNPFIDTNTGLNTGNSNNENPNSNVAIPNINGGVQTTNTGSPSLTDLYNGIPNFDFISHFINTQNSTNNQNQNHPNITQQNRNPRVPSSGEPTFDFANTNGAKVNKNPVLPNLNGGIPNNQSPNKGVPLNNNIQKTNTQTMKSSSNTKNKETGIQTSSNFESNNTNSFFVNGNPPPNSLPAGIPGFNSRISETASQNSNTGNSGLPIKPVQSSNTETQNTEFKTYSYGYQNNYNYKYNYSYEIPYTYTTRYY